jgi:hypothetical protein
MHHSPSTIKNTNNTRLILFYNSIYNRIGKMSNFQNHVISKKNSHVQIGNRNREIQVVIRCYFQHHQNPQRKFHRWKLYENFKKIKEGHLSIYWLIFNESDFYWFYRNLSIIDLLMETLIALLCLRLTICICNFYIHSSSIFFIKQKIFYARFFCFACTRLGFMYAISLQLPVLMFMLFFVDMQVFPSLFLFR